MGNRLPDSGEASKDDEGRRMDDCRFDNWTRMFGAIQDRRSALMDAVSAGVALVSLARADLGFAAADDVLVEGCRLKGDRCDKNRQCCSNKCSGRKRHKKKHNHGGSNKHRHKKGSGECKCLGSGSKCSKDAACCKGRCDPKERRCRCVPANEICNKDEDCCDRRKCDSGFCKT
jgi:hypothetical protein